MPRGGRRATATMRARTSTSRWWISPRARVRPDPDTLTVRTTCTNRDLPSRLPFGNEAGDFELEGALPIKRIVALIKPTDALRPPWAKIRMWRLISHLSLNYLPWWKKAARRCRRFCGCTISPGPPIRKQIDGLDGPRQPPALRARDFRRRHHLRARHPGGDGVRRRAVRRRRRLPVRHRAGVFPGPVCFDEQFQPAGACDAAEKGDSEDMATAGRTEILL